VIAEGLTHAHFAIGAWQDAENDPDIGFLPQRYHHLAGGSNDVEQLVRPTHLDVCIEVVGIVTLHDGVEELVQVDRLAFIPAFVEVITRQELLNGEVGSQTDEFSHGEFSEPLIVVHHLGALAIEDAESLLGISARVFHDLFLAQMRAKFIFV